MYTYLFTYGNPRLYQFYTDRCLRDTETTKLYSGFIQSAVFVCTYFYFRIGRARRICAFGLQRWRVKNARGIYQPRVHYVDDERTFNRRVVTNLFLGHVSIAYGVLSIRPA